MEAIREAGPDDARRVTVAGLATDSKKLVTQASGASLESALKNSQEMLPLWRALGDRHGEAATLNSFGFVAVASAALKRHSQWNRSGLQLWRELGYERGEAETLVNVGAAHSFMGEKRQALLYYEQALVVSRRLQDRRGEMFAMNNIGVVLGPLVSLAGLWSASAASSNWSEQRGDQIAMRALSNMSATHQALGQLQQALEFAERALGSAPPPICAAVPPCSQSWATCCSCWVKRSSARILSGLSVRQKLPATHVVRRPPPFSLCAPSAPR